jgi:hypothetical protein
LCYCQALTSFSRLSEACELESRIAALETAQAERDERTEAAQRNGDVSIA